MTEYRIVYKNAADGREYQWAIYRTREGAERNARSVRQRQQKTAWVRIERREVTVSEWVPLHAPDHVIEIDSEGRVSEPVIGPIRDGGQ